MANKVKEILKRTFRWIIKGIPIIRITAQVTSMPQTNWLKGRVALITGGSSGIGFEIAKTYLNSGANVIITGRDLDKLNKAAKELANISDNIIMTASLDISTAESIKDALDNIINRAKDKGLAQIDILVNNAGCSGRVPFPNTEISDYDRIMNTNLKGVYFLTQEFGRYMITNKIQGNILNIASASSVRPANSPYLLSKWGVRALTVGLAKALIPYNIVVNGIAPGPTATPMHLKEDDGLINEPNNPTKRMAMPEEIANMALVLVSNMGKMIVGDVVYMTGGAGIITFDDMGYNINLK